MSFTCPICHRTSYHPQDLENCYCGHCHIFLDGLAHPVSAAERLAEALHAEGLLDMEAKAREGYYGDFTSPLATPIIQLVNDLLAKGRGDLADRAKDGEFDGE